MYRGIVEAIGLGAMHGVATFLPISLNGHVALAEMLFELPPLGALEETGVVLGTLVATLFLVRQPLWQISRYFLGLFRRQRSPLATSVVRDLVAIAVAQIPRLLFDAWLSDTRASLSRQPLLIAIGLLVTAVALMSTAWIGRGRGNSLTSMQALLLGVVDAVAILPGISRLGCLLVAGMWFGLTERRSLEIALLVVIPSMLGSSMVLGREAAVGNFGSVGNAILGFLVAMATGLLCANALRILSDSRRIAWFVLWVMPLSVATFAFARAWPAV